MNQLVGFDCEWGHAAYTDEDPDRCNDRAVGVVAVLDGSRVLKVKVCKRHRQALIDETDPMDKK